MERGQELRRVNRAILPTLSLLSHPNHLSVLESIIFSTKQPISSAELIATTGIASSSFFSSSVQLESHGLVKSPSHGFYTYTDQGLAALKGLVRAESMFMEAYIVAIGKEFEEHGWSPEGVEAEIVRARRIFEAKQNGSDYDFTIIP